MKKQIVILCILCIMCAFTMLCTNIKNKSCSKQEVKIEKKSTTDQPEELTESTTQKPTTTEEHATTEQPEQIPLCLTINIPLSQNLKEYIFEQCNQDERLYCLVISIIEQESNFKANVIGADGHDYGLMQIRDVNHQWLQEQLGHKDFLNPYDNAQCGIYIIKQYWEKYDYENLALMCYNLGEGGAENSWKNGVYSTPYTIAIMNRYQRYLEQIYN